MMRETVEQRNRPGGRVRMSLGRSLLSFVMILTILLGLFPATAFAEDSGLTVTTEGITGGNCSVLEGRSVTTTTAAKKPNVVASTIYVATVESVDATLTNSSGKKLNATYTSALDSQDFVVLNNNKSSTLSDIEKNKPGISVTSAQLCQVGFHNEDFDSDAIKYYYIHFDFTKLNGSVFGLLIQVVLTSAVDKNELKTAIDNVPQNKYYTSEDRYNGRITSTDGFWAEVQRIVSSAKSVYDDNTASQASVDAATATLNQGNSDSELSKALANCIPTTQVNATGLYELLQTYSTDHYSNSLNFSTATWPAFEKAKKEAQSLLDSLYDEKGDPTDFNKAENQHLVTEAEDALKSAAEALDNRVNGYQSPNSDEALAGIRLYLERYDPEKLEASDYTSDSWTAFLAARNAAQSVLNSSKGFYAGMGSSELTAQTEAFLELRAACHGLVETRGSITVRFSVVENYAIRSEGRQPTQTVTRTLTLQPGTTIGQVMTDQGISNLDTKADDAAAVYLNGILCYNVANSGLSGGFTYSNPTQYQALGLHDGDELVIARIAPEPYANISGLTEYSSLDMVLELARHQKLTTSLTGGAVRAGEPFTVTVTAAKAMPAEYDGAYSPVEGASIYISASSAEQAAAEANQVNADTLVKTGGSGQATVTLYEEGWCLLNAFDLSADGAYTNGGAVLIHVLPASDVDAVKETLKQELLEAVQNADYPESYFKPADWTAIQEAREAGTSAIDAAETTGAARAAQLEQLEKVLALQAGADKYNVSNLAYFRNLLAELPDDLTKLDQSSKTTIESLQSRYADMTGYQRQQLTQLEENTYQEVVKRYSEGLAEAKAYQLRVEYDFSGVPESDREALQDMIEYLQANTATEGHRDVLGGYELAELYTFNTSRGESYGSYSFTEITSAAGGTKVTFCASPEYATHGLIRGSRAAYDRNGALYNSQATDADYILAPDGAGWSIRDTSTAQVTDTTFSLNASRTYTVNGREYEMRGVTVSGLDGSDVTSAAYGFFDFSDYLGKSPTNQTFISITDSFRNFTMPYEDVTFTVIWAPAGGTSEEIAAAREAAKTAIETAYSDYRQTEYSEENWEKLTAAKDDGLAEVDAAETVDSVRAAQQAAIKAMAAVKTIQQEEFKPEEGGASETPLPDYGDVVGQVHIIVENQTFTSASSDGSTPAWYGTLIDGYYDLCEEDTMMTVVLKALQLKGCNWSTGSQGVADSWDDYGISYIASVRVPANVDADGADFVLNEAGKSLGEFSGEPGSGWMGTLNDWFTNLGFNSFSYENGDLKSGDEIRIMFSQNLGVDLGGTWNNADTSLKDLTVSGGSLSPRFDSGTTSYTLNLTGGKVSVTPTAANKNFQVRIYINEKTGDNWYRRGETLPAKAGDTIYIGVGDRSWPSMNNQETEAIEYTGTWYAIKVMDSNSAESVVELIDAIPTITYAGYQTQAEAVKLARDAYDALNAEAKTKVTNLNKLTSAEEAIQFYTEIDDVKELLSKIPSVNKLTTADRGKVQDARNAYDALDEDQKLYITIADVEKFNAAVEWMEEHGSSISGGTIAGVEEMPEEVGETGGGSITITPEASVNSKGEATAKVDAETVEQVLEQAAEDGSISTIVVAPEIDGDASRVTVDLPKSSVSDIAGDSLDLTVSTPIAGMTIPSEGLSELAKQSGSTVSFTAEAVTVTGAGGSKSDAIRLDVAVNGKSVDTVPGGLTVTVPAADAGSVLVLVAEDGTETIIRKSVIADGEVAGLVDGPCTVKIVDNAKTFTDTSGHWAADAIDFASSRELFNGTSATAFSPNEEMTRGMLVTVLHRMEDEAETAAENAFADIPDNTWYADAVVWASENGIVNGVAEGQFDPNANVTREQLAAMMYRYADFLGMDTAASGSLSRFHDGSQVSSWASDAMKWAVGNGLISGKSSTILDPKGNATRAEVATILQRMTALMVK